MTELKEAIKKINSKTDLIKILNFYGVHFNKDNKAICPFHNEKTASLSIQEKNNGAFYHCFGCKEHGDIINFIRKKENLSTLEATKKAYEEYMKLPQSQRKQRIEHRYTKMMDKYNIKMQNLKAQIDHYDSRSIEETKDQIKANANKSIGPSSNTSSSGDNKPGNDEEIDF